MRDKIFKLFSLNLGSNSTILTSDPSGKILITLVMHFVYLLLKYKIVTLDHVLETKMETKKPKRKRFSVVLVT